MLFSLNIQTDDSLLTYNDHLLMEAMKYYEADFLASYFTSVNYRGSMEAL